MSDAFWAQKGSIHWQTPDEIVALAQKTFSDGIGLDPCAAKNTSIAKMNWLLSEGKDALNFSWHQEASSFFINCPFGTSYVKDGVCISAKQYKDMVEDQSLSSNDVTGWTKQTLENFASKVHYEVGQGMSGIWLSKGAMETKAIQKLIRIPGVVVCHPNHRINYKDPAIGKVAKGVNFNSVVIGFFPGKESLGHRERFLSVFSKLGELLVRA